MMSQPPDDPWKMVIDQVTEALTDLGFSDTDQKVADGVRSALCALDRSKGSDATPPIRVLEGGLSGKMDERPSDASHLSLSTAETHEVLGHDDDITVSVCLSPPAGQPLISPTKYEGRIEVLGDSSQTILRAISSHPYRIHCLEGLLKVMIEGEAVDTISEGQSVDVEGAHIAVLGTSEDYSFGHYHRLS
ncbi:MAG TPA: hypothetical protein EYN66_10010 [Myxococcales bacterium]|nr:hypothetical protein [Myxococcales bacterium]